jgi:DNA segregation ATPase FtsK/SpoIIIE, S-DNA-T family
MSHSGAYQGSGSSVYYSACRFFTRLRIYRQRQTKGKAQQPVKSSSAATPLLQRAVAAAPILPAGGAAGVPSTGVARGASSAAPTPPLPSSAQPVGAAPGLSATSAESRSVPATALPVAPPSPGATLAGTKRGRDSSDSALAPAAAVTIAPAPAPQPPPSLPEAQARPQDTPQPQQGKGKATSGTAQLQVAAPTPTPRLAGGAVPTAKRAEAAAGAAKAALNSRPGTLDAWLRRTLTPGLG